jgi:type IV fimbrial biogenesis protein FimT
MQAILISSWPAGGGRRPMRGFTLVELMVTVIVLGILTTLAVPSFTDVLNASRLSGQTNELVSALHVARSEAVRRNSSVVFCRTGPTLAACTAGDGSWAGWLVFEDANGDSVFDAGEEVIQRGVIRSPLQVQSSFGELLRFRSDGRARNSAATTLASGILRVCLETTLPAQNIRDIVLIAGGKTSLSRSDGSGNCAAPG